MLRLLSGAMLVLLFVGQLVRPAGCRSCRVPYCAVSCGSGGVHVGVLVQFPEFGWPGLCSGAGASRTARQAGLGVTLPCSPAGAGGL